jgi:hypothetical protein
MKHLGNTRTYKPYTKSTRLNSHNFLKFFFTFQLAALVALTLAATSPARAQQQANQLPPLIDRELFFGDPEITGAQLSPDGKFIPLSSRTRAHETSGSSARKNRSPPLASSRTTQSAYPQLFLEPQRQLHPVHAG